MGEKGLGLIVLPGSPQCSSSNPLRSFSLDGWQPMSIKLKEPIRMLAFLWVLSLL